MSSKPFQGSASRNARIRQEANTRARRPRITQAELELFLLAQKKAHQAKEALEAIEQRILSRFVAGARVEPGVHAPKLALIVE